MKKFGMAPIELARFFHETYERSAPTYGCETHPQIFSPLSTHGQLMIAVCAEVLDKLDESQDEARRNFF